MISAATAQRTDPLTPSSPLFYPPLAYQPSPPITPVFAQMATHLYVSAGMSVSQHLQRLYSTYGEFVSNNGYFFCYDPAVVAEIISGIRNGGEYFKEVAGYEVAGIRDLGEPGYDR